MEPEKTPEEDAPKGGSQKALLALIVVGVLGAFAVNIAAFMLSADAITAVAEGAGISKTIAWALVLAVDGLMVTGTVVFIVNKLRGRSVAYPLTVLASGVLLSIICNALHAKAGGGHVVHLGNKAKMAVSAIPAVSLALSFHLIADMVKDSLGEHVETVSQDTPKDASPKRAKDTKEDARKDARRVPPKTRPSDRPKTPSKTPLKTAPSADKKTPAEVRTDARQLLKSNPNMAFADVARQVGRKPSGYMRTMCAEILNELTDAGEIDRVRAV